MKINLAVTLILALCIGCATEPPIRNPQISKSTLPKVHSIRDVPVYRQGRNECGPTSLQMVMNFYGKNLNKDEIVKSVLIKGSSTPISNMVTYAMAKKFEVYSFYGWNEEKMKYLIAQGYPLIAIGEIPSNLLGDGRGGGVGHYVVITGYDDIEKKFTINEPFLGQKMKAPYEVIKDFLSSSKPDHDWNHVICIYPKQQLLTDLPTKPKVPPSEKPTTSTPVTPSMGAEKIVTVTWTFANIRSGAGNDYPVVATVKQGDKLVVIGESWEWFNVQLQDGKKGWISSRVVK